MRDKATVEFRKHFWDSHYFYLEFLRKEILFEPERDKTNKIIVHLTKAQISLRISAVWSVFAGRMKKP